MRVPIADVSAIDLTVELKQKTTYENICAAMRYAAEHELKNVLAYTNEKVVSTDFRGYATESIVDAAAGIMLDPTFLKIIGWYDSEYGYTCNLLRLVQHAAQYASVVLNATEKTLYLVEYYSLDNMLVNAVY